MLTELDLKTIFLIYGDFKESFIRRDINTLSIHKEGRYIKMPKSLIKSLKIIKQTFRNPDHPRYLHLCRINDSKIYLFISTFTEDFFSKTENDVFLAFYSDSLIDIVFEFDKLLFLI